MYRGQRVRFTDLRNDLLPFTGVVQERGVLVLEDIRSSKDGSLRADKGYLMWPYCTPDEIKDEAADCDWFLIIMDRMEENE